MKKYLKAFSGLVLMLMVALPCFATVLTVTYDNEQPNTVIRSTHWNQNFSDIMTFLNSNLLNSQDNIQPGGIATQSLANLAVTDAKISGITTAGKVNGSALTGLPNIPSGAGVIPAVNITSGNYPSQIPTLTSNYVFAITAPTVIPTAGATYTNNSPTQTFTVVSATSSYVYATGTGNPTASGSLTKTSGTGDATLTFASWTGQLPALDGSNLYNTSGFVKVQSGTVTAQSSFTISSLAAGTKYKLIFNATQNTAVGHLLMRFNGDSGANYSFATGAYTGSTANSGQTEIQMHYPNNYVVGAVHSGEIIITPLSGNNNYAIVLGVVGSKEAQPSVSVLKADYNGSSPIASFTIYTSGGTLTGNWTLYSLS